MAGRPAAAAGERRVVVLLLRLGLGAGCLLMAVGLVLAMAESRLRAHPVPIGSVPAFVAAGRPSGFMAAGIGLLVVAPLARVAALAVQFAREGDRKFAGVALAVGAILALGVVLGRV